MIDLNPWSAWESESAKAYTTRLPKCTPPGQPLVFYFKSPLVNVTFPDLNGLISMVIFYFTLQTFSYICNFHVLEVSTNNKGQRTYSNSGISTNFYFWIIQCFKYLGHSEEISARRLYLLQPFAFLAINLSLILTKYFS